MRARGEELEHSVQMLLIWLRANSVSAIMQPASSTHPIDTELEELGSIYAHT